MGTTKMLFAVVAAMGISLTQISAVCAAVRVQVLDADPPGTAVTLGRNQNFYLHLRYSTDHPIQIWVRPYYQGKEVGAGSNPSGTYSGEGEAIGWFFLLQPGAQVDEVRVRAGDGSDAGTQEVATYPVQISSGYQSAAPHASPAWVAQLSKRDALAQRAVYEKQANTPLSASSTALVSGFMLLMFGLGLLGLVAPVWALWRWRGLWRISAAIPAAMMAFVVLRLLVDTARNPTSHNLWPFEIVWIGTLSVVIMAVLFVLRKIVAARGTETSH